VAGEKLGTKNADTGKIMPTNKLENYISALQFLIDGAKSVYGVELTKDSPPEDIARHFWHITEAADIKMVTCFTRPVRML